MNKNQQPTAEPRFKLFSGALKAFTDPTGRRQISCTASSAVDDLHGDLIIEECVRDMAEQARSKGMTIFLNHDYSVPEDVFGKTADAAIVMRPSGSGTMVADMDLRILLNEANPRAVQTYEAIAGPNGDDGVTLGVSIGAIIEDYEFRDEKQGFRGGLEIKRVNLLEASIVGIPANPRSWVQNGVLAIGKSLGIDEDDIKAMFDHRDTTVKSEDACPSCGHGSSCEENCSCESGFHSGESEVEPGDIVAELAPITGEVIEEIEAPVTLSHNELPDAAFACIESGGKKDESGKTTPRSLRHYPHHTASGDLDKNLLRNALSRIGDKSNIQCGKSHLMAHAKSAGIGEKTEDGFEVKMGDEIWVVRDIDPEFDHEPEESEGYEGSCSCSDSDEPTKSADLDLAPDGEAQVPVEETTEVDLDAAEKTAEEIAKEISPELREAFSAVMKALDESVTAIETLKAERDELKTQLAAAKADFEVAAEIVDSLSRLPLARKTSARAQINSFNQKFSGIYSDSWLKLIDDRNKETKDEPLP